MAQPIVSSVVQWIGTLLIQEGSALLEVEDQVRSLQKELEFMQLYLQDADAKQQDRHIGVLIRQIRELAYDAEDVIDTYILKVQARAEKSNRRRLLRSAYVFLYNAPRIYSVGKRIQVIKSNLKQVTEKFNYFGVRRIPELREGSRSSLGEGQGRQKPQSYPYDDDDDRKYVVGWEKDIAKLVEILVGEGKSQISFLSIVGMGGSGKTTLARKLYNHPYIKEGFNCCAWVRISQEWSTQHVLSQILRKISGPEGTVKLDSTVDQLVDRLRSILENKFCLIVLDDVWRREALEDILPALPKRGSKIIITTRNQEIVQFLTLEQNQYIYEPPPLSDKEAWELFSKIVLSNRTNYDIESFKNLGKEMLKKCDGLPLAIVALSGILRTKGGINEWKELNDVVRLRVMEGNATHKGKVGDFLALSYDDLPYYLKPCFLYLGVFPEDCQIPTGMLTRMWIAEGLVTARENMSLEEVAIQQLEELSDRFMVQTARTNFKGEIKAVRLHDLLRDLSIRKAREQSFLLIYAHMDCPRSSHDVPPHFSIQPRRYALHSSVTFPEHITHLRSLTMLPRSGVSYSAYASKETLDFEVVYNYDNFKLLRLLNLWGIKVGNGSLPAQIGSLVHLRYLGIRASNIVELPTSIGNLRNLLTLDYRNVNADNKVPIKIPNTLGKLVLLRQLFLPIECPWSVEDLQLSAMKDLRTLWGVKQDGGPGGGNWLSREVANLTTTLRKLKIVVSTQTELAMTFNLLSNINGLRTFHCEMRDDVALQQVEPISNQQQLHKLIVIGEMRTRLAFILPCNLVMLELKHSKLKAEDPMAAIGALKHLKLLRLSNFYIGASFSCKRGSFPQLEELYLADLDNLNCWVIEEGSMLRLKKLEILGCRRLGYFPKGLLFVTTLQELEYLRMSEEFGQQASEYGWSQKRLRLPRNWEDIIQLCDSPVDTSSISKLYQQLIAGVYLNGKTQKYWVIKQEDCYHNCFMLYAKNILPDPFDVIFEAHPAVSSQYLKDWGWSTILESDGTLVSVAEMKRTSRFMNSEFSGELNKTLLSFGITYEIVIVVMLPKAVYATSISAAVHTTPLSEGPSKRHEHSLHDKPRDEWIRLLAGTLNISVNTKKANLYVRGMVPGMLIKGVIIEPVL